MLLYSRDGQAHPYRYVTRQHSFESSQLDHGTGLGGKRFHQIHQPRKLDLAGDDRELIGRAVGEVHRLHVGQMLKAHHGRTAMAFMGKVADDGHDEAARVGDFSLVRSVDRAGIGLLHEILGIAGRYEARGLTAERGAMRQHFIDEPAICVP